MATNKQLVEQAVAAIPLWRAFLDQKEAEQNLILQQMQDDETQFAPKSFTQRLTDRFRRTPGQPEPLDHDITAGVELEKKVEEVKEVEEVEEVEEVKEVKVIEETEVSPEHLPVPSDNDRKQPANNKDFKDLF